MATRRKIGATIALDGEKQFRSAVTQSTSALKTMKSEMKLVSAEFAGQANTLEALTRKNEVLTKTLDQTRKVEADTAAALSNAKKNYEETGAALEKYRDALDKSSAELEEMKASGSAASDEIAKQQEIVDDLTRTVKAGETTYARAGANVETWSQKLNAAKTDVATLSRQLDENNRYMEEARNSADGVAHSIDGFGKTVKSNTTEATGAVKEFSGAVGEYFVADKILEYGEKVSAVFMQISKSAYNAAKDIDAGYDSIITKTGATGDTLASMTGIADDLYGSLPVEMSKVGDAIGEVSTRWHLQGEELKAVAAQAIKFSELNKTEVVQSIDSAQNMLSAFGEDITNIGKAYDVMNATGQKTGVHLDNLASKVTENAAAFREMGMDLYQSIDFMGQLETSGADASSVLSGMRRALKSAVEDGKPFNDALAEMQDRIQSGTESMDGLAAAYDLFGKSGEGVYQAVKTGSLNFTDLADSQQLVADSIGSVANTYDQILDPWDKMTVATNNLKSAGADLVGEVLEDIEPLIVSITDGVKWLRDGLDKMNPRVKSAIAWVTAIGAGLGVIGPKVLGLVKTITALKTATQATKALKDIQQGIEALSGAKKSADAVNTVAEAVSDVSKASKGVSDVTKMAGAVGDIGDAAKNSGNIADMADNLDDMASSSSAAQAAVSGLSAATKGLLVVGAVAAGTAIAVQIANAMHESFVQAHDDLRMLDEYSKQLLADTEERITATETAVTDARRAFADVEARHDRAQQLVSELEALQNESDLTNAQLYRMQGICRELNALYPDLGISVNTATGEIERNGRAVKNLQKVTEDYYKTERKAAAEEHYSNLIGNSVADEAQMRALAKQYEEYWQLRAEAQARLREKTGGGDPDDFGSMLSFAWARITGDEDIRRIDEYTDKLVKIKDDYEELTGESIDLNRQLEATEEILNEASGAADAAAGSTDGLISSNQRAETSFEKLAKKIRDTGGALIDADFTEDEAELQELYARTIGAWQSYHDTFTAGLSDEVSSLAEAMGSWSDYRKAVEDALKSNAGMFNEVSHNEELSWETMTQNLADNAEQYAQWNDNVSRVLNSTRYANDEAFREMANSIMLMGTSGADYLQEFVNNVALDVDSALDDLGRFSDLGLVQSEYATNMANLQFATEQGMGGIAAAFNNTASEAEVSLQSLSDAIDGQVQAYSTWYENVTALTNSDRYASDDSFRQFANNVLSYGMAGAEMLDSVVEAMDEGSAELDETIANYLSLQGANEKAAQAQASIQATLQDGLDQQVSIVDNAQGQLQTTYGNAARAGQTGFEENIDLIGIMNGELTGAEQAMIESQDAMNESAGAVVDGVAGEVEAGVTGMIETSRTTLNNFATEAYNIGLTTGKNYAAGMAAGMKGIDAQSGVSRADGNAAASGGVTNNINMTVNGAGQDPEEVAELAANSLVYKLDQQGAVYGY